LPAIIFIVLVNIKDLRALVDNVHEGAKNSVLPIFATGSEVGFGAIIASVPAFTVIRDVLLGVSPNPLVAASLSTTALAGITGSASGGLTIALQVFGEDLRAMAVEQGVTHRQAYKHFAVITILIPLIATAVLVTLGTAGIL
jgi:H+/gluconate symporter-like permease